MADMTLSTNCSGVFHYWGKGSICFIRVKYYFLPFTTIGCKEIRLYMECFNFAQPRYIYDNLYEKHTDLISSKRIRFAISVE